MKVSEARAMLAPAAMWGTPANWADLGCGTGTFTRALAELVGVGSNIHAVDRDARALASIPATHEGARIITYHADFDAFALAPASLDGVLLANSLHYVRTPAALLDRVARALTRLGRCILVEYDIETPIAPWVPFPLSMKAARDLFRDAGLPVLEPLTTRPSLYGRGPLYSLQARRADTLTA
jgi:ubiquinone/menaquinone biosynthesis C-methylase UbiE